MGGNEIILWDIVICNITLYSFITLDQVIRKLGAHGEYSGGNKGDSRKYSKRTATTLLHLDWKLHYIFFLCDISGEKVSANFQEVCLSNKTPYNTKTLDEMLGLTY